MLQPISQFAAAIGVCVAAIYYIVNLRISQMNQELNLKAQQQNLETRQAQLFLQLYSQYYNKDWLEALRNNTFVMHYKDFDEFMAKYGPETNPEAYKGFDMLSHYFEGAGVMVKNGLINPKMVADLFAEEFRDYWEKASPVFLEYRKRSNNPKVCENQEYLYNLLKSMLPAEAIASDKTYWAGKNS